MTKVVNNESNNAKAESARAPLPSAALDTGSSTSPIKPANNFASVSLILGIISIFFTLVSIPGLITSIIALRQLSKNGESGQGTAIAGLVLNIIGFFIGIFWLIVIGAAILSANNVNTGV
ncbi:DUF4190 domain-containing protein [Candidatus Saccharibacteria bacterium]|nr:DUF4190 domain-containing protein [Candidatus Saccharibacteria bacterium]